MTTNEYDDASNLVRTVDAKGQEIRYQYDGLNRLVSEFYDNPTGPPDVAYHYDFAAGPVERGDFWTPNGPAAIGQAVLGHADSDPSQDINGDETIDVADVVQAATVSNVVTAANTRGHLAWVADQSGEEHQSNETRGRSIWAIKRISDRYGVIKNYYKGME